ncbi:hypothetical protein ROHU_036803 [Labeo rohita]|uniref:DUF6729 domain-containing protein n=1 Tax=Labeo rohita TaxID=84645 RepID=A0A498LG42_LABRO|nr:hypothetical protein ROHU_035551 [Labeo rohita]RXN21668.1 hypothetical protein ROHU_036803 [Labeo rohita]
MSTKPKSHKAMDDGEWMARLRAFASSGAWSFGAGNRPAPRQRKWYDLYQKIEKCPLQAHGQTTLFGGSTVCSCGFHTTKPETATSTQAAAVPPHSEASDTTPAPRSFLRPPPSLSMMSTKPKGPVRTPSPSPSSLQTHIPASFSEEEPGRVQPAPAEASASFQLRPDLKLWYEPPVPALMYHQTPTPDRFFYPSADGVDALPPVEETLRCTVCSLNYLSMSQTVRNQLDLPHQKMFRLILTRKYACDIRVIRLLRDRTLGNSPTRLVRQLKENHGQDWPNRLANYLGECADFVDRPSLFPVVCQEPPEPVDIPTSRWLLSVYGRDILCRIGHIKASITSIFGNILKMHSTKKITKKLAGHGWGTALNDPDSEATENMLEDVDEGKDEEDLYLFIFIYSEN